MTLAKALQSHLQKAMQLHQAGNLAQAEKMYREVLSAEPKQADALHLLGAIHWQRGELDEGEKLIRRAIGIWDKSPGYFADLGGILKQRGALAEAIRDYKAALALDPAHKNARAGIAECLSRHGFDLAKEHRWAEAEAAYNALLEMNPNDAAVLNNLAEMHQHAGDRVRALALYDRALAARPGYEIVHYNRAICHLGMNDLPRGWADMDASVRDWLPRMDKRRNLPWLHLPLWDGSNLSGKKILIWGDQGIGDEILFAGMVTELVAQGARVTIECTDRLAPLFARSFPSVIVIPRAPWPFLAMDFACHAPGMWLARRLRPDFGAFPPRRGYLLANEAQTENFRARYRALAEAAGKQRVVGISWHSTTKGRGLDRRITLMELAAALPKADTLYIDLQYGEHAAEIAEVCAALPDFAFHHDAEVDQLKNMDAFAAQLAACDGVATIGNTTAHMAGALGVSAAVLLPVEGLTWYWFEQRPDSPWYPSLRLLRKTREAGWREALERLAQG